MTTNFADWTMVVVTVLLLVANMYQIRKFSKTFLAETLLTFRNDYSSKEMRDSFDAISNFSAENPELIERLRNIYLCCKRTTSLEDQHIEIARSYLAKFEGSVGVHRSRIAWFFNKVWRLEKRGFIDRRTLETICGLDGARIFIESVCPMTLAIRLARIHKGDKKSFLRDPSVQWYTLKWISISAKNWQSGVNYTWRRISIDCQGVLYQDLCRVKEYKI